MNEASIKIIFKNAPRCEDFSGNSFVGILHENYEWDEEQYWLLDKCLYDLVSDYESIDLPRDLTSQIVNIYSYLMMVIQSHFDSNDGFTITNLDNDSLYEWRERLQLVIEGFFTGKMPSNSSFEYKNPLL